MLKDELTRALTAALVAARDAGDLLVDDLPVPIVERPRDPAHGDFASNLGMVLAKKAKKPPLAIAQAIAAHLGRPDLLAESTVAAPGFLNLKLAPTWLTGNLATILRDGPKYGRSDVGHGQKVLLEFVSANPTGPLHVGHGRWAAIGSTLANLMKMAGFDVAQEFYINDAGNQMLLLGRSLEARMRQALGQEAPIPEEGYHGVYMIDAAKGALANGGEAILALPEAERVAKLTAVAQAAMLAQQQSTLVAMGVKFDRWFSETTLHEGGKVEAGIAQLKANGALYEKDGAWWLRSTDYADDKDRVVVRDNGAPTYLAADIAYHKDKLDRGHERLVNILGADHHGYVARLSAVVQSLGGKPETLEVIIGQMVNLFRDKEPVRMSKRSGEMVTLQEVIEEVGVDAARYFLTMRSTDTTLDFDLELAKRETADNPVFYVQYAHARISSILRMAEEQGHQLAAATLAGGPLDQLVHPDERVLLLKLASYPDEIAAAAIAMEPYRLARFAQELATSFHQFYTNCRVLGEAPEVTRARLALIVGTRMVLRSVLEDVLGVSAPERMASTQTPAS